MNTVGKGFQRLTAGVIVIGLILGFGLIWLESTRVIDWSAGAQTIIVSSTETADNCDRAATVGDGACNQLVSVLDTGDVILLGVAVLLIAGAFSNLVVFSLLM